MLLRISLVVALVAGLATLYVGHFKVSERINTLTTDLEASQTAEQAARQAETRARNDAKQAREELALATEKLEQTAAQLQATAARLSEQEQRANRLFATLEQTTLERNQAQQELAAYRATGVAPEQIKAQRGLLQRAEQERDAFIAENKILLRNINQLENELSRYVGDRETEIELPTGLKGRVLAVDPRYEFVVLDIGENQGVLENGKMLVNRDGKLIAKVRITRVEPNRSIANIIPDWKQDEVMEGDQVIY